MNHRPQGFDHPVTAAIAAEAIVVIAIIFAIAVNLGSLFQ